MALKEALWLFPPRSVILLSTVDAQGRQNLAPYSEFIKTHNDEFVIALNNERHSLKNIRETGEFVVSIPTLEIAEKTAISAKPFPEGVSEFEKAGLTPEKAGKVKPALVKECIANFECKLEKEFRLNENAVLIVGKIEAFHYAQDLAPEELKARLESNALMHVAKGRVYCNAKGETKDTGVDITVI